MEQSILQKKLAEKTCGHCGALGRWKIICTKGSIRWLQCEGCGIGGENCRVVVTAGEVEGAMKPAGEQAVTAAPRARPSGA
jgi:MinD superfamily P-loop ATPase